MPSMPMAQEPQGAPPAEGGGDDLKAKVAQLDGDFTSFVEMALQAGVPDSAKAKLSSALEGWKSALAELSGEGGGEEPANPGAITPEQGGSATAVPMRQ